MSENDRELGEIATTVLFENERVKVWNLIVEPGEASPWHVHERDYITVVIEAGGLTSEYDDGSRETQTKTVGDWRFTGEHRVHRVINETDRRYVNVLIELK